jgi:hypothetical protein
MSGEYTHWINPTWGAAVFVDAGNAVDNRRLDLAVGYGVGARWRARPDRSASTSPTASARASCGSIFRWRFPFERPWEEMSDERGAHRPPAPPAPPPPLPRRWRWLAALSAWLALLAGAVWLLGSEGGLRVICRAIEGLAAGQLTLIEPAGTLRGRFPCSRCIGGMRRWISSAGSAGRLAPGRAVARPTGGQPRLLRVTSLRFPMSASSEAAAAARQPALPLAVEVEQWSRAHRSRRARPSRTARRRRLPKRSRRNCRAMACCTAARFARASAAWGRRRSFAGRRATVRTDAKAGIEGDAAGERWLSISLPRARLEEFASCKAARGRSRQSRAKTSPAKSRRGSRRFRHSPSGKRDPAFGRRPGGLDRRCSAGCARSARRFAAAGQCRRPVWAGA